MSIQYTFTERSALIVIDVQKAFNHPGWGNRNNPCAEEQIAALLDAWRAKGFPIVHIQHASASPTGYFQKGQESFEHKEEAKPLPGEPIYVKSVNSAFIGTPLEAHLRRQGIKQAVIVGLITNHCVSTTARMSGNLGFDTYVVEDATATFDRAALDGAWRPAQEVHAAALSDLSGEFATILSTSHVLAALSSPAHAPHRTEEQSGADPALISAREIPSPEAQRYIDRILRNLDGREPLDVLRSTVDVIQAQITNAAPEELSSRPQPVKWSAREILAHLADTETVLGFRLRQILSQSGVEIPGFYQDSWAVVARYQSIPANRSLERLLVNRAANLDILENLSPAQMDMYGIHAQRGRESVAHLCRLWAGHDLNHLAQISKLIQKS